MADDRRRPESEPRTLVSHPELRSQQSFPFFSTVGGAPKSWLERTLSLFADVRAGEGVNVLLLTVNVFLLLAGYSLLKPAREALIITEGGARVASYAAAAQALLLLGVVPFYGWVASRVPRVRLIGLTAVFFAANLVLFNLAGQTGLRVGVAFFIWLGIYSVFIVSQFWAFANDVYTEGQGRRLFPIVGVGASLGAWVGAATVEPLVEQLASHRLRRARAPRPAHRPRPHARPRPWRAPRQATCPPCCPTHRRSRAGATDRRKRPHRRHPAHRSRRSGARLSRARHPRRHRSAPRDRSRPAPRPTHPPRPRRRIRHPRRQRRWHRPHRGSRRGSGRARDRHPSH
jgi:hypothetical protein